MKDSKRIAVVTGGAAGIGARIVSRMADEGCRVALFDKDAQTGEALAAELRKAGGDVRFFACDLTKPLQIESAFDRVVDAFGGVDVLVNNAGVGGYQDWRTMGEQEWTRFFAVNCDATFLCIQRAAREMVAHDVEGHIAIVLSQASVNQDVETVAPYGVSKWCERGIMKGAAEALRPHGITVNGVCPGTVWTPMMDGFCDEYVAAGSGTKEQYEQFICGLYPTSRIQTADDIAAMCAFATREGCTMTGQTLLVSGGIVFS